MTLGADFCFTRQFTHCSLIRRKIYKVSSASDKKWNLNIVMTKGSLYFKHWVHRDCLPPLSFSLGTHNLSCTRPLTWNKRLYTTSHLKKFNYYQVKQTTLSTKALLVSPAGQGPSCWTVEPWQRTLIHSAVSDATAVNTTLITSLYPC